VGGELVQPPRHHHDVLLAIYFLNTCDLLKAQFMKIVHYFLSSGLPNPHFRILGLDVKECDAVDGLTQASDHLLCCTFNVNPEADAISRDAFKDIIQANALDGDWALFESICH
jgi:hypothetical protein